MQLFQRREEREEELGQGLWIEDGSMLRGGVATEWHKEGGVLVGGRVW